MTRILGIISLKGGVGKTSLAVNIGASMAGVFNKKVLLVDANVSVPNMGYHVGLFEPKATVHDVLNGKILPEKAVTEITDHLHVLPGAPQGGKALLFKLKEKLSRLRGVYDVIILDSAPNVNDELVAAMLASDELYVVTSPDFPALSSTLHAINVARERNTKIHGLILNKVRKKSFELSLHEIQDTAQVPVIAVIEDNDVLPAAVAETRPLVDVAPRNKATISINKLAAHLLHESYEDPRWFSKIMSWLKKDIPVEDVNRAVQNAENENPNG